MAGRVPWCSTGFLFLLAAAPQWSRGGWVLPGGHVSLRQRSFPSVTCPDRVTLSGWFLSGNSIH